MSINWKVFLNIVSDLFVNFAASWYLIVLIETRINKDMDFYLLILRLFFGSLSLIVAYLLRSKK